MAKSIGIRLYLDGAGQFNSDVRNCNNSLKQFQSELKVTKEEFKNNENSFDALSKKSETLEKLYETSAKKVEAYAKRITELNKAREEENQKIETLQKKLDEESKKLSEIESTAGKSSEAYKKQSEAVESLQKSLDKSKDSITRLDNEEIKLNTSLNNATAEQLKYGNELDKTNGYLAEAEKSADGYAKSIDSLGNEIKESDDDTKKMVDSLEALAKVEAFEVISDAAKEMLDALIECAETAEKFEDAMAKVQSIAQVSSGELDAMATDIRRVAVEMGYGTEEVAEATYQAMSASVEASEAVGFVADASKLARAGFTETTTAVDVLTTAINAYGKESNTAAHIADDLITTQNLGKTTVNELAQSMGQVIPTASALGVSLDQLSSMYVLMTKQGINTANSTTYIRAMMNELSDSSSDLSETLANLTGHTFGELMKQGYTIGDVMKILGDSVDGNSESFKNLFSNVRAGLGALSLYNQGADEFNKTLATMETNAGATDKAFGIMADTAEMTNAKFQASAENLRIAVGETLSPAMESLKEKGITILQFLTAIVTQHPKLVAAITGAVTAVGVATAAVTGLAMAIGVLKAVFGDYSGLVVLVTAGIAAASGAVAGLTLEAQSATSEFDEFKKSMEESAKSADELHKSVSDFLGSQETNSTHIDSLINRIEELNKVQNLTVWQKQELKNAANDLNTILGEEVVEIDRETGHLTDNTEEWKNNAIAKEAVLKQSGLEEKYNDVLSKRAEIEAELWDVEDRINEIRAKYAVTLIDENGITREVITADEELKNQLDELYHVYNDKREQNEQLAEDEERLKNAINETKAAEEEAAIAAGEYTDSLGVAHDSALSFADAQEAVDNAIKSASEAIGDQIGLFDEWSAKSDLTLKEMESRWKGQTEGVNQYKDDLVYLKEVIDSDTDPAIKNLASNMANMGVGGAAEIHNFVEGLKEIGNNKDKVKELAETWQEHIDAIKEAEGIYASVQLEEQGYVEDSEALFKQFYTSSKQSREEFNGNMVELTETGIADQVKAVEEQSPILEEATQKMMDNSFAKACEAIGMSPDGGSSTKFSQMGKDIVDSITQGFEGGDSTIGSALGGILQKAADNIDVSGIADKINSKIGESLNREAKR